MKNFCIGLLALVAATATSSAQDGRPFDITVTSGVSVPTGEFGDRYGTGFHVGVSAGYPVSQSLIVAPKIEFHNFSINEDAWIETGNDAGIPARGVDGGTRRAILAGADLRLEPSISGSRLQPFIEGGLGAGFMSGSSVDYHVPGSVVSKEIDGNTKFFWNVGVGMEFGHTENFSFLVMGRFLGIPGDETEGFDFNAVPISLGIRF